MRATPSLGLSSAVKAGVVRRATQVLVALLLEAVFLFLAAGTLDWLAAWAFLGVNLLGIVANAALLLRRSPETVAERGSAAFQKRWDKLIGGLWALMYYVAILVIAGLDRRFAWSPALGLGPRLAGLAGFACGLALFSWALIANAYFSTVVRVQADRGHTVCSSGPYRFVRHPGYLGAVAQTLCAPLALGSLWALIPGALAAALMVLRTALEDRTLHAELPGYAEYARAVRYRLLPGLW